MSGKPGLSVSEAGASQPPAPREPEGTPARICLSHRLAVRAGAPSGAVRVLTRVLTTALDDLGLAWTCGRLRRWSEDGCGRAWMPLIFLRIRRSARSGSRLSLLWGTLGPPWRHRGRQMQGLSSGLIWTLSGGVQASSLATVAMSEMTDELAIRMSAIMGGR